MDSPTRKTYFLFYFFTYYKCNTCVCLTQCQTISYCIQINRCFSFELCLVQPQSFLSDFFFLIASFTALVFLLSCLLLFLRLHPLFIFSDVVTFLLSFFFAFFPFPLPIHLVYSEYIDVGVDVSPQKHRNTIQTS